MMEVPASAAAERRMHDAPEDGASAFSAPSGAAESAAERMLRLLLAASLAAGALLRTLQYASGRALWLDEAVLAASVTERGFAGLMRPLEYGQTAPLGFLFLQKTAVALLGAGEHALRLFPFLAGMAALVLFAMTARRWTSSPGGAALAVAMFALAPFLVYYSAEAKPYAFDALAAVAVLACAAPFLERATPTRRDAALLLVAGAAGVWLSQPVVFVLAGVGLPLGIRALRAGDRAAVRTLAAIGGVWVASFAGSYAFQRGMLADAEYIRAFWRSGFPPLPPRTAAEWGWLPRAFARVFREPLGVYGENATLPTRLQTAVGLLAFVAGCVSLWRRDRLRLAVLVLPIVLVLAAATPRLYPFGGDYPTAGRVLLFLLPALLLVIGEGVAWTARGMGRAGRPAAVAAAVLLLLPSLGYAALAVPHMRAEMKPLLQYAAENRQPGDVLYVHYRALPAFDYYAARYGWTGPAVARGTCARREPARYMDDLARLRGTERAWILFVDGRTTENFDERTFMTAFLDHLGAKREAQVASGAWLYLYDLRPENARPGPFRGQVSGPPAADDASFDCRGPWAAR
jgi:hypothetical protein